VVRDVGEQDLVHDDRAHRDAHDDAEGEHEADRRRSRPVVDLARDELRLGHHLHVPRQPGGEAVVHDPEVGARREADEPEGDRARRALGEDAEEVEVARDDRAVDPERRPEREQAAHLDAARADLGLDLLARPDELRHRPELGPRLLVVEDDVGIAQLVAVRVHRGHRQHVRRRIDAEDEHAPRLAGHRVLEGPEPRVDRAHGLDPGKGRAW
jgi:hypothetical protein